MLEVISQVQSVETSITLDLQGRFSNGTSSDSGTHTAAVNSTATIESSFSPLACHGQFYSSIQVDGAVTREERENYIVPDGSDYVRYDYVASTGDWTQAKDDYDSTWRQLQFGISLGVYESYMNKKPSLDDQMKAAGAKAPKANLEPVQTGPER